MTTTNTNDLPAEVADLRAQLDAANAAAAQAHVDVAFAGSAFIKDETVYTPNMARKLYEDHFEVDNGRVVAYDAPRGTEGRSPLVNGSGERPAFDEAMRAILTREGGDGLRTADAGRTSTSASGKPSGGADRIAAALASGGIPRVMPNGERSADGFAQRTASRPGEGAPAPRP